MTVVRRRSALRWLASVGAIVLLAGGGALAGTFSAVARVPLPPRSAAQLLTDVQQAHVDGFSGAVSLTANLGLPSLPGLSTDNSSSFQTLMSGTHTMRVWFAGPDKARIALMGRLGEADLVRNGADGWLWSSTDQSVTHYRLPAAGPWQGDPTSAPAPGALPMTPQQTARQVLAAIGPSTAVSTDPTAVVAGRSAYELVLTPRTSHTLVGSVRIAVDGRTHVPLRVEIFARGDRSPSLSVGFTSFHPTSPASSVFAFTPPPGATVTEGRSPSSPSSARHKPEAHQRASGTPSGWRTVGKDWSTVVVTKAPASLQGVVNLLPAVSGSWGTGHLLQGTLFSALVTADGRLVIGATPPSELYQALATK